MLASDLNVCMIPLEIVWDDIELNLKNVKDIVGQVHEQTDLLILPETFASGFPIEKTKEYLTSVTAKYQSEILDTLLKLSADKNMAICAGLLACEDGKMMNKAVFIEPNGELHSMAKNHLFSMAGEQHLFESGKGRLKLRYRGWNIAVGICYDVRFPVWCRNRNNEYDLMAFIANWPQVRVSAWNKLLPARAIENECYVCAVNCKGEDNKGFSYDGASHVIDFKGKEIGAEADNGFIYARLSKEKLESFRKKFPAWMDADEFELI